jgi:hypothetical protein
MRFNVRPPFQRTCVHAFIQREWLVFQFSVLILKAFARNAFAVLVTLEESASILSKCLKLLQPCLTNVSLFCWGYSRKSQRKVD